MKLMIRLRQAASAALVAFGAVGLLTMLSGPATAAAPQPAKPTIVLVHGAWADSSSWEGVILKLQADGYTVIAAANQLRALESDAEYLSEITANVNGPVVLVGHSYGGSVITNAATTNIKALVYVAGFAPDTGESALTLATQFPGSLIGGALAAPIGLPGGAADLYIQAGKYQQTFAADLPEILAAPLPATQRPVTNVALTDPSGTPAWQTLPSWFVYGSADNVIPPAAHAFMAHRAGAERIVVVPGASHLVLISHPLVVAGLIEEAAIATAR